MISVIMSTYNKAKYLDLTLAGYQLQTYKDFEIIVVDDGGSDDTQSIIEKYKAMLNINYLKQNNTGIAKARNKALQIAKGRYIIIVDDDRIPSPDFVYSHKKVLETKEKIVSIGKEAHILTIYIPELILKFKDGIKVYNKFPELLDVNYKQILYADDIIYNYSKAIEKCYLSDSDNGMILDVVEKYDVNLEGFHFAWSKAYGGNIAFDRSLCIQQPQYDLNYIGYGGEDVDFSYQLYLQGFDYCFNTKAINYHQEHKRSCNEAREMYINFKYFCNKFPHLEVLLMRMDWDGVISLEDANSFLHIINLNNKDLRNLIDEYIARRVE